MLLRQDRSRVWNAERLFVQNADRMAGNNFGESMRALLVNAKLYL